MRIKKTVLMLWIALMMTGCQSMRKAFNFSTTAELQFEVAEMVNPDSDGRSSPVVVHLFALSNDQLFKREDFLSLYSDAESRLQSDLLEKQLLKELVPGEVRMDTLTLPIETKYIGLMAEFVRYEGAKSLLVLPVRSHNKNSYSVELNGNNMAVSKEERVQSKKVKERKKSDPQESNNSRQVYSR